MPTRVSTPCRDTTKIRPTSGKEKEQSQGKEIPTSSSKQARQSSTVRVIEEMGTLSLALMSFLSITESW